MTRDNSTDRVCTCVICLVQFTPFDRRSKGRICPKTDCRREWNRRSALKQNAHRPKPEPKQRIAPIRPTLTVLQPCIAPYIAALAAARAA